MRGIETAYYALRALQSIYSDGGAAGDTQEAIISGYHSNLIEIIADKIQPAIDAL